ncbi:MAG: bifunctional DNA-formamidopyrimidine glycosylase/DNA-(apurinic or apyrimidinic site) lyase [Ginsengibacter sp.]
MPEIPDIENFCKNLKTMLAGKKLQKVKVINGKKLQDNPAELSKRLQGSKVSNVFRSGKELRMAFSNGSILGIHLMLTGDLIPFEGINERKSSIIEFHFEGGPSIVLADRMKNANVKLDPEDKEGIDALDKKLDYKYLRQLLNKKANVKNILLDQNKIRGIGNSYSDEILWQTRISPFSVAESIPDDKVIVLAKTIKSVLTGATIKIAQTHPGIIFGEVKEFLQIHTKKKTESPTGYPIKTEDRGMLKTYYTDEQVLYK